MPQAIGAWIATSMGVAAGGVAAGLINAGVALAFNYAVSKIFAPKGPKPKDLQTEVRSPDPDRIRIIGRAKVSGAVMFYDWAEVGGWRVLYKLMAISQGGYTGIDAFWLNDKQVALDGTTVTTPPWDNDVRIYIKATGDGGDYPQLRSAFPANWTTAHRLTDIGTVLAAFDAASAEDIAEDYPGGDPTVTVLVRGAPNYNPVLDNYTYSENLAAQIRGILTHPEYGILTGDDLDAASWDAALSDCTDPMPLRDGGTRPRYFGGGAYSLKEPIKDVAQRWLDAMGGQLFTTAEGKVGLRVAKWRAPNYTITEDKIASFKMGRGSGELDRVTTLHPKYTAPEADWVETTADPWDDAEALDRYGEMAPKEMPLPVVQHHGHARRLAKIKIAKLNPRWRFEMRLRFWGLLLLEEETVYVNIPRLGIENEPFWIDGYGFDPDSSDGPCFVRLIHARPESFDWTGAEDGNPPGSPGEIGHAATAPAVLSTFTVIRTDGPPFIRITVIPPAKRKAIGQYRRAGSTDPWTTMQSEGNGSVLRTLSLEDRSQYDIRFGVSKWLTATPDGAWQYINGIEVYEYETPPSAPVLVSATGTAGGSHLFVITPDLGVNYWRTKFYRAGPGQPFSSASLAGISYEVSNRVNIPGQVPAEGARYWMQSENRSERPSALVEIINIVP